MKTNTTNGVCTGVNDEVVTRYEYNSDNLFLTGVTVTAVDGNNTVITKRTCYQYDQYGNKIGETEPKANLTQCVQ
jgi:YD repeat-containing protein